MELTREFDVWKDMTSDALTKMVLGDESISTKAGGALRKALYHALDRLWFSSALEVIRKGDVYNPGARAHIPQLYLIDSYRSVALKSLPTGEAFTLEDGDGIRYEVLVKRMMGDTICRDVEGNLRELTLVYFCMLVDLQAAAGETFTVAFAGDTKFTTSFVAAAAFAALDTGVAAAQILSCWTASSYVPNSANLHISHAHTPFSPVDPVAELAVVGAELATPTSSSVSSQRSIVSDDDIIINDRFVGRHKMCCFLGICLVVPHGQIRATAASNEEVCMIICHFEGGYRADKRLR